jgi:hypothetical protein
MNPVIQLIQLTLRVERKAEAQRRPSMTYRDGLANEKTLRLSKRENRVKGNFNLLRRQQGECA